MDIRKIDALELLKSLDDKSVDMILTDPPYYKLLDIEWDKQWDTKDKYLEWLEIIIIECKRVLKTTGSFYMFASCEMSWYVEGLIRKHFNVLNHIRWANKESYAKKSCKEKLRRFINNSEEIIFSEPLESKNIFYNHCSDTDGKNFYSIIKYLNDLRLEAHLSMKKCNEICNNQMATHYFTTSQWRLPTEINYNKLKKYIENLKDYKIIIKEYNELQKEYLTLRRTFNLNKDIQYNNTWNFKGTKTDKDRHKCEKPENIISHIINVSTNENDLVIDMFAGSGSISKCCFKLNRRCIACDIDDTFFKNLNLI